MSRPASSNHKSTPSARSRISKAKSAGRASIRKRPATVRTAANKRANARPRVTGNAQKRTPSRNTSQSRASIRSIHGANNNAVRHGRSTNGSRGTSRTKKNTSTASARKNGSRNINSRSKNNKKGTMNNNSSRRRLLARNQQKKKKKSASVTSLLSTTASHLVRPADDFHRESSFETHE